MAEPASPEKKPGRKAGYRKPHAMSGRVAMRVPQELEDWLAETGGRLGLTVSDMARMILMEKMHEQRDE